MIDRSNASTAPNARRPILIGGLGLSGLLAAWMGLGGAAETGDGFGTLGIAAIVLGAWFWRRQRPEPVVIVA